MAVLGFGVITASSRDLSCGQSSMTQEVLGSGNGSTFQNLPNNNDPMTPKKILEDESQPALTINRESGSGNVESKPDVSDRVFFTGKFEELYKAMAQLRETVNKLERKLERGQVHSMGGRNRHTCEGHGVQERAESESEEEGAVVGRWITLKDRQVVTEKEKGENTRRERERALELRKELLLLELREVGRASHLSEVQRKRELMRILNRREEEIRFLGENRKAALEKQREMGHKKVSRRVKKGKKGEKLEENHDDMVQVKRESGSEERKKTSERNKVEQLTKDRERDDDTDVLLREMEEEEEEREAEQAQPRVTQMSNKEELRQRHGKKLTDTESEKDLGNPQRKQGHERGENDSKTKEGAENMKIQMKRRMEERLREQDRLRAESGIPEEEKYQLSVDDGETRYQEEERGNERGTTVGEKRIWGSFSLKSHAPKHHWDGIGREDTEDRSGEEKREISNQVE